MLLFLPLIALVHHSSACGHRWEGPFPQRGWPLSTDEEDPFPPSQTRYEVERYEVSLFVTDGSDSIDVEVFGLINWLTLEPEAFVLDLASGYSVGELLVDGEPVDFTYKDDLVTVGDLAPRSSNGGSFRIVYSGVPSDGMIISTTKFGERCFFTDHWPNRAHFWLACNDHPADKASVAFTVTAPSHYDVIATGLLRNATESPDGGTTTHVWSSDIAMSTKVVAVGIAKFSIDSDESGFTVPTAAFVYPENEEAGFESYSGGGPIMETLQAIYGEFPFEKNVHVQSKTVYGGMENAGNIFYSEGSVGGGNKPTTLFAHELGHQWFGDAVTECEWSHIWLSEGFATLSANLNTEQSEGRAAMEASLRGERAAVLRFQASNPANAVVCRDCYDDLLQLLNTLSYEKGGFVLHMLRYELGDEAFFEGVRSYYARYRNGCALSVQLQSEFEASAGRSLEWFFQQWIHSPGHPILDMGFRVGEDGDVAILIDQVQTVEQPLWPMAFSFKLDLQIDLEDGSSVLETVRVDAVALTFVFANLGANVTEVTLDPRTNLLFEDAWDEEA